MFNHSTSIVSFVLCTLLLSCGCGKEPGKDGRDTGVLLHRISEIQPSTEINTHVGEEKWSVLQPIWSDFTLLSPESIIDASVSEDQRNPY